VTAHHDLVEAAGTVEHSLDLGLRLHPLIGGIELTTQPVSGTFQIGERVFEVVLIVAYLLLPISIPLEGAERSDVVRQIDD